MRKQYLIPLILSSVLLLAGCGDIGELTVDQAVEKAWGTVDELHEAAQKKLGKASETAGDTVSSIDELTDNIREKTRQYETAVNKLKEGDLSGLDEIDLTDYRNFKVEAETFVASFSRLLAAGKIIEKRDDELGTAYIYTFEGEDGTAQNIVVVCSDSDEIAAISISRRIRDMNVIAGYVLDAAGVETNVDFDALMDGLPEETVFEKNGYRFIITEEYITVTKSER